MNGSIWKTLFLLLSTANLTGFGTWIVWGSDSVKHSEIDAIMATRAPYMHDKQRIDDHFSALEQRVKGLEDHDYGK